MSTQTSERYILRGVTELGRVYFYTGRAGNYWTADSPDKAFKYETVEEDGMDVVWINTGKVRIDDVSAEMINNANLQVMGCLIRFVFRTNYRYSKLDQILIFLAFVGIIMWLHITYHLITDSFTK